MQCAHGIKVICTAHGEKFHDIEVNNYLQEFIKLDLFEKIIFLKSNGMRGKVESIKDLKHPY